ncbi:MAG: N-acetyl-gamma-glutamyl-phosphate reductase [Actinomycetota bacterium]
MSFGVGVVGASGYTGAELLRLLAGHPGLEPAVATSREFAGQDIATVYPNLVAYAGRPYDELDPASLAALDLVFLALPHGASMELGAQLAEAGVRVVDLSADFRLQDAQAYPEWFGKPHAAPEWLGKWTYGLPELHRQQIAGAPAVANPGCYPTAALLALAPLVAGRLIDPATVVVNAASGVSGAGRGLKPGMHFAHIDASFKAYAVTGHKHTPEIEQELGRLAGDRVRITFVPHLAPMTRGLLATCIASLAPGADPDAVAQAPATFFAGEPFVRATAAPPETKFTLGSNAAHVWATADARTGRAIAIAAIDNLGKGAAGQAIQNANLMLGLPETLGLAAEGVYP